MRIMRHLFFFLGIAPQLHISPLAREVMDVARMAIVYHSRFYYHHSRQKLHLRFLAWYTYAINCKGELTNEKTYKSA